jgi:L-methionine (R)-S-oxide reductase
LTAMNTDFPVLLEAVQEIVDGNGERDEKLKAICRLLSDRVPNYDWVGFYIADLDQRVLNLGPYVGEPTEHVRIPFGRGICGQVADKEEPLIVQDVSGETNYLSCNSEVKSEIVVPVMKDSRSVAQIDIDSHTRAAFSRRDGEFLADVCSAVSQLF